MPVPAQLQPVNPTLATIPLPSDMQLLSRKQQTLLPLDMCRCHDSSCALRDQCVRWIDRHVAGPVPHVETFTRSGEPCAYRIQP